MGKYRRVLYDVGTDPGESDGVRVGYEYRECRVSVWGWYGSSVGIEPVEMSLGEFLSGLHITLEDCERALKGGMP